jgi:hypothetical protein
MHHIGVTLLDRFEDNLRQHPALNFPRGPDVEWRALPPMVQVYRDLLLSGGMPPNQDTFAQRVVLDANRLDPGALPAEGVYARACKTFPSLIRQHHLAIALHVTGELEAVKWIPWLDYQGIDLLCLRESFAVGVALSIDTKQARFWKRVKEQRQSGKPQGLTMVELDVNPQDYQVGEFFLHPPSHVDVVIERMHDLIFSCRTMAIPNIVQARQIFREALALGAFSGKPGWLANGAGFYWALVHDMRLRAAGQETHPSLEMVP